MLPRFQINYSCCNSIQLVRSDRNTIYCTHTNLNTCWKIRDHLIGQFLRKFMNMFNKLSVKTVYVLLHNEIKTRRSYVYTCCRISYLNICSCLKPFTYTHTHTYIHTHITCTTTVCSTLIYRAVARFFVIIYFVCF